MAKKAKTLKDIDMFPNFKDVGAKPNPKKSKKGKKNAEILSKMSISWQR